MSATSDERNDTAMPKPISVQLYSLREESKTDFVGVLKRVAAMGYKGVEPAGLYNLKPAEFLKIVTDLGMQISSSHGPWVNPQNLAEVIDTMHLYGLKTAIGGYGPKDFETEDKLKATADTINGICAELKKAGLTYAIHNHNWEFDMLGGRIIYDRLMEMCPNLLCEIDIYWAANFGKCDPAEQVQKNKKRVILMHVKDGPLTPKAPMTAAGAGKVNIAACVQAADPKVLQWLVVELDACATDMTQAVEQSYRYLTSQGLAQGNR